MSNMSYCRFQNTLQDLRDCYDAMGDTELSNEETRARIALLRMCYNIVSDYVDENGEPNI